MIPIDFLLTNHPNKTNSNNGYKNLDSLKFLKYSNLFDLNNNKNDKSIFEWIKHIAEYGVCVLQEVECKEGMVKNVAELIAPVQKTIYGDIFDVKVDENPINIAYSNVSLGFHMDLMYYESPPGLQFLHCIKFDQEIEGGESIFLDSFQVAEEFRFKYPNLFDNLTRIPATFQKLHFKRESPVCMIYQRPHIVLNNKKQVFLFI
jgi:hypothetical protein